MKKRILEGFAAKPLVATVAVLLSVLGSGGPVCATERPGNSLAPAPGYVPELKFSEKRTEQLVVKSDPEQPDFKWLEVSSVDATSLTVKMNLAGLELSEIGPETSFSLVLGDLSFDAELGDDPAYSAGKTAAFFPTHGWDSEGKPVGAEGLSLSWNADALTVKLVNSANSEEDHGPFSPAYSGNYEGENNDSVRQLGALSLNFGPLMGDATLFVKGSASTSHMVRALRLGDFGEQFELTQTSLGGGLDLAVPKVVIKGTQEVDGGAEPVDGGEWDEGNPGQQQKSLVLKGTASDGFGLSRVEVSLDSTDPGSWQPVELGRFTPVPSEEDEWSGVSVDWTFPLPAAVVGRTVISVRAVDLAGNVSAPSSFTIVRDLPAPLVGRWDALITAAVGDVPGVQGALTFQCSAGGALSGRLTMNGRPYPFLGDWTGGEIRGRVKRGAEGDLILRGWVADIEVQDVSGASLSGVLTREDAWADDSGSVAEFTATRSPYSSANRVGEERVGSYNAAFRMLNASEGGLPGSSLLCVKINGAGGVQALGKLADGSQLSWGGVLGANGEICFYAPVYGRRGYLAARLYSDGSSVYGDIGSWVRPAGFGGGFSEGFALHGFSEFTGIRYFGVVPSGGSDAVWNSSFAVLFYGDLEAVVGGGGVEGRRELVVVDERGRVTVSGDNPLGLRIQINPQTGWVTGGFRLPVSEPGGKRRSMQLNGLLVSDRVAGHFASQRGGQSVVGQFEVVQKPVVDDPVVDDGGGDVPGARERVGGLGQALASIESTPEGRFLTVWAQGWVPSSGYSDPRLVVGQDGVLDFTVVRPVYQDRMYLTVIQSVEASVRIPYSGEDSVLIRVGLEGTLMRVLVGDGGGDVPGARERVAGLENAVASIESTPRGRFLTVWAQGWVPSSGYSDPRLVVGQDGVLDFTVARSVYQDRMYPTVIRKVEASVCIPYAGEDSVLIRVGREGTLMRVLVGDAWKIWAGGTPEVIICELPPPTGVPTNWIR